MLLLLKAGNIISVQSTVKLMPTAKVIPMLDIPKCGIKAKLIKLLIVVMELNITPRAVLVCNKC